MTVKRGVYLFVLCVECCGEEAAARVSKKETGHEPRGFPSGGLEVEERVSPKESENA